VEQLHQDPQATWLREGDTLVHHLANAAGTRYEAEIASTLSGGGLSFRGIEQGPQGPLAVFDVVPGQLLENLSRLEPLHAVEAMVAIVNAVAEVHAQGLVHGQLHPANIFLSPDRRRAWLGGFDQSSRLDEQTRELQAPERLPYRLAWMSPEQTGRMNRSVGYRADYYALGVTLFRLLTGRLPFEASDAMGWVHAHIARPPLRADAVDDRVPEALALVVAKLLEKNAEDRYQSTHGLLADLERCRAGLTTGTLEPFPLGEEDRSHRFTMPSRLYGREREVQSLMQSFERAADHGPPGVVLVSGWSGIGKSALMFEVHRPLAERLGTFLSGKSEPHTATIPYHSLLQALGAQCTRLLTWSEERVGGIRRRIQEAVHPNGQVLVDVLPELELVLGPQPSVAELGTVEAHNRFSHTLLKFVQAMAGPAHPVLLFLDDLQWIDAASLEFLSVLLESPDTRNLLLLGAYRSNEVSESHPVALTIPRWEQAGVPVERIELEPLTTGALRAWLADLTHAPHDSVAELAVLVEEQTGANPFFVRAFLKELHLRDLLTFDAEAGHWRWDLDDLRSRGFTDNVIEHMVARITRMEAFAQRALSVGAAMGAEFELGELADALELPVADVAPALWQAAEAGLVVPLGDARGVSGVVDACAAGVAVPFRFMHDRVQEAAYALIDGDKRPSLHLDLATRLARKQDSGRLFEVVSHYQRAKTLLEPGVDNVEVAALLLRAGSRARRAGAHAATEAYLSLGVRLVEELWDSHYPLVLELHTELARTDYLLGNIERAEQVSATVLEQARSEDDRLPIHEARVLLASAEMKLLESVDFTIEVAARFGLDVPILASPEQVGAAMGGLAEAMAGRSYMDLVDLDEMEDDTGRRLLGMLAGSLPAAAMAKPEAYAGLLITAFHYMLEHGLTADSATVVSSYGLFLQMVGMSDPAYETGGAARAIRQRFGYGAGGFIEFGVFVRPWKDPLKDVVGYLKEGAHRCLEAGHQTNWGYCVNQSLKFTFLAGYPLEDADQSYEKDWADLTRRRQINARGSLELWGQAIACLRDEAPDASRLKGARFDGDATLPFFVENRIGTLVQYILVVQAMLAYYFGDYERALEAGWAHEEIAGGGANSVAQTEVERVVYRSLAALALPEPDLEKVRADRARLAAWNERNPVNYASRLALVDAELARVEGRPLDAMSAYDRAAELAQEHPFPQHEALPNERAAIFHHEAGRTGVGNLYLERALTNWAQWGATAKVRHLRERFGLGGAEAGAKKGSGLDADTLLKAADAFTSEIVFDRLMVRMLTILVENAGATRGALVLPRDGRLHIAARAEEGAVKALAEWEALDEVTDVSRAVVRLVQRSGQSVVLDDASEDKRFRDEREISERQVRSLICTPLRHRGELIGVLYLENNAVSHAFTVQRCEVLSVLGTQAAISIENARMVDRLEQKVEERTRQLVEATKKAEAASEAKTAFLRSMSHELRTPLNSVLGYASLLLQKGGLTAEQQSGLANIDRSGRHLLSLIDEVLDMSKVEAGRLDIEPAPTQLRGLVAGIADFFRPTAAAKKLDLQVHEDASLPERVETDERRLRQVLLNLMGNAVKFTAEGEVEIRAEAVGNNQLVIRVRDTGPGLRPEELGRIFGAFEQAGDVIQRAKGTGLGLAISRRIAEAMGGTLDAESVFGEGSTFVLTLPLVPCAESTSSALKPEASEEPAVDMIVVPPLAELEALKRMLDEGDLFGIARRMQAVAEDSKLRPFAEQLGAFAQDFDDAQVEMMLRRSMEASKG